MKKMSTKRMLSFTFFWFGTYFLWSSLMVLVFPAQVEAIVGSAKKTETLSLYLALGALVATFTEPIIGSISDRCTSSLGRRRPFVITGGIIVIISLVFMGYTTNNLLLLLLFCCLQFGNNVACAGYQGLLPDTVPDDQKGTASSFMGIMMFLGTLAGLILLSSITNNGKYKLAYLIIILVYAIFAAVTIFTVKEEKHTNSDKFSLKAFAKGLLINPKKTPRFAWLLLTSLLIMMGYFCIFDFLQYYVKDVLHSQRPPVDAAILGGAVLIGATIVSFIAGTIAKKIGNIKVVFISTIIMAITALTLIFAPNLLMVQIICVFFGFGYGGYMTVQWALVTDCLPDKNNSAKDIGIWTISSTLSQVIAPLIGGFIISSNSSVISGYRNLFILVIILLVFSSFTVFKLKKEA